LKKRVILYGIDGKMGRELERTIQSSEDFEVACGVIPKLQIGANETAHEVSSYPIVKRLEAFQGDADLIIDFSHPSNLKDLLQYISQYKIPTLIATTGYEASQLRDIEIAAKTAPILLSSNTSYGVQVMRQVAEQLAILLDGFDIEIIEKHHALKQDAPSGTAKLLLDTLTHSMNKPQTICYGREGNNTKRTKHEIGVHSVRGGSFAGEHTIIFAGEDEVIEIKHTAFSKRIFAEGALKAARKLLTKQVGLYSMAQIYEEKGGA
jgi:4-hydroxy-tetrahydrodipicolinate reductase